MGGFSVAGKVCLITGSAGGIGKALANQLLGMGAKVCLSDVNESLGLETLQHFKEQYNDIDVTFYKLNVVDREQWQLAFDHCEEFFKEPVEMLINNAGIAPNSNHDLNIDINIRGVMHGSLAFVNRYGKSKDGGRGGRIVQISSMAGLLNGFQWDRSGYEVSKWGVVAYTRQFAESGRKTHPWLVEGVKAYAFCPLFVDTPILDDGEFDKKRMERRTGFRTLKPSEMGTVLANALKEDDNGAVYAVLPDLPVLKVPNWNKELMAVMVGLAKLVALVNPQQRSLDTKTALVAFLLALLLFAFFLGVLTRFVF